jgi:hypothetical protein
VLLRVSSAVGPHLRTFADGLADATRVDLLASQVLSCPLHAQVSENLIGSRSMPRVKLATVLSRTMEELHVFTTISCLASP